MLSVGVDLVEISRIEKSIKNPRFCKRVLGKTEYLQLMTRGFPVQSVAASFCAKEAFSKLWGPACGDSSFARWSCCARKTVGVS